MQFVDQQEPEQEPPREEQEDDQNIWDEKQFLEVLKHYSEDKTIPEDLRSKKWSVFGKALINTFLNKDDLPMIDIYSQILRIDEMQSKPPYMLTFKQISDLDEMNFYLFLTAKRAIGMEQSRMNERTLQNTQIGQSISSQIGGNKRGFGGGGNFFSKFRKHL